MFQAGGSGLSSAVSSVAEFRYSIYIKLPMTDRDIVNFVISALLEPPEQNYLYFYLKNSWHQMLSILGTKYIFLTEVWQNNINR